MGHEQFDEAADASGLKTWGIPPAFPRQLTNFPPSLNLYTCLITDSTRRMYLEIVWPGQVLDVSQIDFLLT